MTFLGSRNRFREVKRGSLCQGRWTEMKRGSIWWAELTTFEQCVHFKWKMHACLYNTNPTSGTTQGSVGQCANCSSPYAKIGLRFNNSNVCVMNFVKNHRAQWRCCACQHRNGSDKGFCQRQTTQDNFTAAMMHCSQGAICQNCTIVGK